LRFRRALVASLAIMSLGATACSAADSSLIALASPTVEATTPATGQQGDPTTAAVSPTAAPALPETPEPEGSVQDVAAATVKILADGTFVPPFELAQSNVAGIGTGFIIDEAGTIVTNNHVVTGATSIEVFLDGQSAPTPARLLGVSECSDLAVLQLEGSGYDFLEFRDVDDVMPGLPVFAAGYPLNLDTDFAEVDYTLTAGIVSTTQASGETAWASVDSVIEHDARIRGGNSGGPLVDEQARVVGINYAGESTNDLNEAIAAAEARSTIDALRNGDVESLGINGQATIGDGVTGVWVAAIAEGTPAARAGLIAGDLILTMNGQELATNGTMTEYCEIVRATATAQPIDIEVLRLGTEEILEGQINGRPLVQTFSLTNDLEDEMADNGNDGSTYTDYVLITDDTDSVRVEVPVQWLDRDGSINENFGESIYASTDLDAFSTGWDVPGLILERSSELGVADHDAVLDLVDWPCDETSGREDFETEDALFAGRWEVFSQCGGTGAGGVAIAVSPADGNSVVRLFVQIITDADIDAAQRAIATFDAVS